MKKAVVWASAVTLGLACSTVARRAAAEDAAPSPSPLSPRWEELTGPDFAAAVARSGGTAIVPLGIVEKHGPHLPLGTDLLDVRELALRAAKQEYVLVFPPYYFGQIFEARHQPGTLAYSERLVWELLQETVDEIARNGVKKIILVNGHGGNNSFLPYFCQSQLARRRAYAVFLFQPSTDPATVDPSIKGLLRTPMDLHGGEIETSTMLAHHPDIVHPERAASQSGRDEARLPGLTDAYTAIWWYARFPNHYAGDGSSASRELGDKVIDAKARQLVAMVRSVKADTKVLELQKRFFDEAEEPLATPQQ